MAYTPARNLRGHLPGAIVLGMARKPLFQSASGPVLAVTWPFHDTELLTKVHAALVHAGYDVWIQRREGAECHELIIGHRDTRLTANADTQPEESEIMR